jgi:uncharacterized protein YeaC (DUF1315 family)
MFTKNLRFFGQILHPQWPAQCPKMGQKRAFILQGLMDWQALYNKDKKNATVEL